MKISDPEFSHWCKQEHPIIGHNDSGEDERCPLCRCQAELVAAHELLMRPFPAPYDPATYEPFYKQWMADRNALLKPTQSSPAATSETDAGRDDGDWQSPGNSVAPPR